MKYFVITYGCQLNQSDSERIISVLETAGYQSAPTMSGADLIVINMCSIRQSAVDRVYGKIQDFIKLKNKNPNIKTLLSGCILKKDLKKFKQQFDFILPIKTLKKWPAILNKETYFYYPNPRENQFNKQFSTNYFFVQTKPLNDFSIQVPISSGCNNFCTYCVVPYVRGSLICRSHKEILKEIRGFIKKGFKEIWLLGQNVNDYTSPFDKTINFPKLLKMVNGIPGRFWIRFTSPHPKNFSKELIDIMASCKKITPYLNLPVQSGDNKILKKMNRPYTVEKYKRLVKRIRKKIPNICLSTDVIVGFPGETKKQFENTVKLFKEIKYDMAYISIYSSRTETAAFKFKHVIPHHEKQRRHKRLTEILKQTALENNKKYIGKTADVLMTKSKNGFLIGKTDTYKTVRFQVSSFKFQDLIGKFVKVKIIDAFPWGLKGVYMELVCT